VHYDKIAVPTEGEQTATLVGTSDFGDAVIRHMDD
jgi:hypothetical protein